MYEWIKYYKYSVLRTIVPKHVSMMEKTNQQMTLKGLFTILLLWWWWWQWICVFLTAMQFQEWLRSLRFSGGNGNSEVDNLKTLLPSLPSSFSLSSLSLSPSSIIGLGALASLTTYWLVTRPRPIQPPCDLQAQSIPVQVSVVVIN